MFKLQREVELVSELGAEGLVAREIQPGRHGVGCVADSNKVDSGTMFNNWVILIYLSEITRDERERSRVKNEEHKSWGPVPSLVMGRSGRAARTAVLSGLRFQVPITCTSAYWQKKSEAPGMGLGW